jgi:hypothetical protein
LVFPFQCSSMYIVLLYLLTSVSTSYHAGPRCISDLCGLRCIRVCLGQGVSGRVLVSNLASMCFRSVWFRMCLVMFGSRCVRMGLGVSVPVYFDVYRRSVFAHVRLRLVSCRASMCFRSVRLKMYPGACVPPCSLPLCCRALLWDHGHARVFSCCTCACGGGPCLSDTGRGVYIYIRGVCIYIYIYIKGYVYINI